MGREVHEVPRGSGVNNVHFSTGTTDWSTPQKFFESLHTEFGFQLDACATPANAKCWKYYTPDEDGLTRPWSPRTWCNPPYGYSIGKWVKKAYDESRVVNTVVMLIPAKTETAWWHDYVMKAAEIRLVRGRLRFGGSKINAPFPSAVVVFKPGEWTPTFTAIDRILDSEVAA